MLRRARLEWNKEPSSLLLENAYIRARAAARLAYKHDADTREKIQAAGRDRYAAHKEEKGEKYLKVLEKGRSRDSERLRRMSTEERDELWKKQYRKRKERKSAKARAQADGPDG